MKVLAITSFFLPHNGGVENYVSNLAAALYKHHEVVVDILTCNTENTDREEKFEFGAVFRLDVWVVLNGTYPIPKFSKRNFRLLRLLKSRGYQLFHTHTRFYPLTFMMSLIGKVWGIPQVHTEHGSSTPILARNRYQLVARIYDSTIGRCPFRWARVTTAVSRAAKQFAHTLGGKDVRIIPVGIQQFRNTILSSRENLGYTNTQILIVFAGRLIEAKGVQDVLAVLSQIIDPRVVFCIIGDGSYRKALEQQIPSNHCVEFKGVLDHQKVLQYLAEADIVVNPSYSEGMPTTVLEAAVLGRAIIASDVGGTREILPTSKEGMLHPPADRLLLGKYLNLLIQDSDLRKTIGEGAKRHATSLPSWEDIATHFFSIYAQFAKS